MEKNIICAPIFLFLLALASCGNAGGGTSTQEKGPGTATLSWDAPTTNADGTSLDDLAGYKIYYGTSSGNYTDMIDITDPKKNNQIVESLASGTYYFAATAYDTSENESDFSNEVNKTK